MLASLAQAPIPRSRSRAGSACRACPMRRRDGLTQDAGVAVARGERLALLESMGVELRNSRIGPSENEVRDVASQGGRQLEAMAAGAGVDKHSFGDFADHGLPVGADVVEARPAATRPGIVHQWVAPGDCVLQRELFFASDR